MSRILAIETSCDETGVAIIEDGRRIVANEVASQIALHAPFGGVVPELASRQHTRVITQLTEKAIKDAAGEIDAVAATTGPGLMGSLLVGVCFAKSLAYSWKKPFIPVHHIEGHIFSVFLAEEAPEFPFLALIVSGGHTQLVWCPAPHQYEILGATRDDAIGECFDKVARLLELPYPGGPSIQKAAEGGDPHAHKFPRAMTDSGNLDFSYSGLKTAVLYALRDNGSTINKADLAASFQYAAVDALLIKTRQAIAQIGAERLVLAGGVAANRLLRQRLPELGVPVFMPSIPLCMDNAAMIGAAAHSLWMHGKTAGMRSTPRSDLPL
ncbi:MAG: tRNA N6-adenosine threonylcarbamoyltransferase [Candidatus Hydrogenedentota bacterium]